MKMGHRGRRVGYPGNGPFRNLPPWQRPGWVYGYGRGYGRGYYTGDPTRCARFPSLPRWWWANPEYQGMVPPVPSVSPTGTQTTTSVEQEREFLKQQMQFMEQELKAIRGRLEELHPGETE